MISRRNVVALIGATVAWPLATRAQQPDKVPRIGYLTIQDDAAPRSANMLAFLTGLRELGYIEGSTIAIEYRWAAYKLDRLASAAEELVLQNVDVIVALEPAPLRAAARATSRIPIVMRYTLDPVVERLVASLARPGGNITGVTSESAELHGKRLELLRELNPRIAKVAVLWSERSRAREMQLGLIEAAAAALGCQLVSAGVSTPDGLTGAFEKAAASGAEGLIIVRDPLLVQTRDRIIELAARHRLLAVYDDRNLPEAGGLMSYGTSIADLYRRAATYVDKIIKGAKPADLPVEQPTKFELVINLKTAKALGVAIPPALLARADEVIE